MRDIKIKFQVRRNNNIESHNDYSFSLSLIGKVRLISCSLTLPFSMPQNIIPKGANYGK